MVPMQPARSWKARVAVVKRAGVYSIIRSSAPGYVMSNVSRTGFMSSSMRCLGLMVFLSLLANTTQAQTSWWDRLRGMIGQDPAERTLSVGEIADGLREALMVGTDNVVARIGREDGFNLDPDIRIPLPRQLDRARNVLSRVGMDDALTDLETRLNRAAEIATPRARALFMGAIAEMTIEDVLAIYNGPEDAATRYFRAQMSEPLDAELRPVVEASLAEAGAVQAFEAVMERYRSIPFAPRVEANLTDYVIDRTQDGIFFYLAREEAAIRADPARRTTELLRRVFGR
jgi:hypothetical protein